VVDHTLLLVEDDSQIRSVLAECLEHDGLQVVEAESAEAATTLLEGKVRPSILVTDINLGPGETGLCLADRTRRMFPMMPVVFITGRMDMLHRRGLKTGEHAIPKPFPLSALTQMIKQVLTSSI
jgi:CheY-like chemotaxis protein